MATTTTTMMIMDLSSSIKVDPTAWCTSPAFTEWNCDCNSFDVATGVGQVNDCLYQQDCGRCNTTDSCMDTFVSVDMREDDSYMLQVCQAYDIWSLCIDETIEAANVRMMDSCVFSAGGFEYCCDSSDTASCGYAFCPGEDDGSSLSFDVCLLLNANCPRLESDSTPPPSPMTPTLFDSEVSNETSTLSGDGNETLFFEDPMVGGEEEGDNSTIIYEKEIENPGNFSDNNNTLFEIVWEEEICNGNLTSESFVPVDEQDCGMLDIASGTWFSIVGNGDYVQLVPSCSEELSNVTVAVIGGTSCNDLSCIMEPELFDISCTGNTSTSTSSGEPILIIRYLQPGNNATELVDAVALTTDLAGGALAPLDFLAMDGVTYYIQIEGIDEDLLLLMEDPPFEVVSLGPGPETTDGLAPTAAPSSTSTSTDTETDTTNSTTATEAPSVAATTLAPATPAPKQGSDGSSGAAAASLLCSSFLLLWVVMMLSTACSVVSALL